MEDEYGCAEPEDGGLPVDEGAEPESEAPPGFGESARGMLLCGALVFIAIYEAICKKRATKQADFDLTSVLIMQSVASIAGGGIFAVCCGQMSELVGEVVWYGRVPFPKHATVQIVRYAPVGMLFSIAAYVQLLALFYLAPDVFKVLEQSRLLLTAILAQVFMRRRLSISSWVALVSITLVACLYVVARQMTKDTESLATMLSFFNPGEVAGAIKDRQLLEAHVKAGVSKVLQSDDVAQHLTKEVISRSSILSSSNDPVGYVLTFIFVALSCIAAIYAEGQLKHGAHVPFYIQKVYMEVPAGICAVLLAAFARPILCDHGIATEKLKTSIFADGFFKGWNCWWVVVCWLFMLAKSWLSGLICKQLSSLSKQLCSITAVVLLYFVMLIHSCPDPENPLKKGTLNAPLWCPEEITSATFAVVVADLAVLCSVVSYITAQRDKQRKTMYKKQLEDVDEERKALLSRDYYPANV